MFQAGAASLVLEVFDRRRGQTARSVRGPPPAVPFRAIRRHLKGQLATSIIARRTWQGPQRIPAAKLGHSALHLFLHTC